MRVTFPQQVCFLSQIRPAFEDALHDANWNYWFFVAFIAPFCIFTFAYVLRRNVIYFAPVAIAAFLLAYCLGIRELSRISEAAAQTEDEWELVCQDTGRVFAPLFVGVPLSLFGTGVAFLGIYIFQLERNARALRLTAGETIDCESCGRAVAPSCIICPRCMKKLQKRESSSSSDSLVQRYSTFNSTEAVNPYAPPFFNRLENEMTESSSKRIATESSPSEPEK